MTGLPDFRNSSVLLRIFLAVNLLGALTLFVAEPDPSQWFRGMAGMLQMLEPGLLLTLLLIGAVGPSLTTSSTFRAWSVIFLTAQLGAIVAYWIEVRVGTVEVSFFRYMLWTIVATAIVGGWLSLRQQARSPALLEARLMALSARIRPHFLFNSLNGILGIIRADPHRAERALEELAELFRALMQDPRELVPLSEEIALCRQYIELERLRLGERIRVNWDIEQCPPDALMPPLMLQPLLENAVYHGIEPAVEPGTIEIKLVHTGSSIVIVMSNPHPPSHNRSSGNQMALTNIRERLSLFYDLAASLDAEVRSDRYAVRIVFPYRKRIL